MFRIFILLLHNYYFVYNLSSYKLSIVCYKTVCIWLSEPVDLRVQFIFEIVCLPRVLVDFSNFNLNSTELLSHDTQSRFIWELVPLYVAYLCAYFFFARCSCKCHMLKLFSIISVKAKSFADREIRYTLKAQGQGAAGTFNIGPTSGIVKLAKELDFEDLRQPHIYSLIVTATEDSGGFSTSVEVNGFMFFSNYEIPFCCYRNRNNIFFIISPLVECNDCYLTF